MLSLQKIGFGLAIQASLIVFALRFFAEDNYKPNKKQ